MSRGGQECTQKDLRVFFVLFLALWIYSTVAFCHGLNKQLRWERTAGAVVDLHPYRHSKGGTYYRPEISFRPLDDDGTGDAITFVSAAEVHWYEAERGTGEYYAGKEGVAVAYNPHHPSRGPEIVDVNRRQLMFSGPMALFLSQIGLALGVYFSMTTDGGVMQQLGLGEHLAPASREDSPAEGALSRGAVVV